MSTGRAAWREVSLVAAVMVIVALIVAIGLITVVGVTLSSIQGAQRSKQTTHHPSASGAGAPASSSPAVQVGTESPPIHLEVGDKSVAANEIVRLTGRYRHPHGQQDLHVQLRRHGRWITFPLPAVTSGSGRFQSFVELAHRGANRVRMIDRSNGQTSNVATVNVR
ncbi:MAG: hypothetical protein QOD35_2183 [Nocardioidaceae bacterium]|jgi:hypothetical protein|nr:hypothetical protein [Nocardioidaceae bacterium]